MDRSLFRYIWKHTWRQQAWILGEDPALQCSQLRTGIEAELVEQ